MELTGVRIDVKPGRHSVSLHDAIFDFSVDPNVSVVGLDAQDKRPWWLVLQDHCVQTVVLTLRAQTAQSEPNWTRRRHHFPSECRYNSFTHLLEDRFVVVDVVDSYDDLGRAAQRVRSTRRVVIRGGDVENVLRSPEPGRRTPPQLDDAYTHRGSDHVHQTAVFPQRCFSGGW